MHRMDELFQRLLFFASNTVSKTPLKYTDTILAMPVSFVGGRVENYMPRVNRNVVLKIAESAARGDIGSMLTLGMMYGVGLGVPLDQKLSLAWSSMSMLDGISDVTFQQARKSLREHLDNLPEETFVYPEILNKVYKKVNAANIVINVEDVPKGNYWLSPLLGGLRVYLTYRIEGKTCYLYDARIGETTIALDELSLLDIPLQLGTIRGKSTQPDYCGQISDYLKAPPKVFVVSGTLLVPKKLKELVKNAHPESKTLKALFRKYIETKDDPRGSYVTTKEFDTAKANFDRLTVEANKLSEPSKFKDELKVKYDQGKTRLASLVRNKNEDAAEAQREELRLLKRKNKMLKSGELLNEVLDELEAAKVFFKKHEKRESELKLSWSMRYLENAFKFVATDLYVTDSKSQYLLPLGTLTSKHLTSLGFLSFSHPAFDNYECLRASKLSEGVVRNAVDKFKKPYADYSIVGVVARSLSSTPKERQSPITYLITDKKGK